MAINKKIHYCWFGNGEKSEIIKNCINSWQIYLPDYEIIEWNEKNFDINMCKYVKDAYENKKFAFVSDYVRFYVLYNYGGIYLDVDVEVIKPLDNFLKHDAFVGFESKKSVNPGLVMGAKKGNKIIKEILESYSNKEFILKDGSLNTTTVVKYTTDILLRYGLRLDNTFQILESVTVYPKTFFCPLTNNSDKTDFSENTYTIHHFAGTWLTDKQKKRNRNILWKIFVPIIMLVKRIIIRFFGESVFQSFKSKVREIKRWVRV